MTIAFCLFASFVSVVSMQQFGYFLNWFGPLDQVLRLIDVASLLAERVRLQAAGGAIGVLRRVLELAMYQPRAAEGSTSCTHDRLVCVCCVQERDCVCVRSILPSCVTKTVVLFVLCVALLTVRRQRKRCGTRFTATFRAAKPKRSSLARY